MPENNTKDNDVFFGIDLPKTVKLDEDLPKTVKLDEDLPKTVKLDDYDFEKCDEIQIFMLTTTLPNPYTLVMFGVLKLFLETIKKQCPNFNNKLRINFLLLHEIAKYKEMVPFFEPIKEHYEIFLPEDLEELNKDLKEDATKRHISSIIEMRLNEIKTLVNMILLNIVDKDNERLITKDNILNFNYDDIFHLSDNITNNPYENDVNSLMELDIKKPESPLLQMLLFEPVCDGKDALVKCLLKIFCNELSLINEKDKDKDKAIFFVIDRWFKEMIKDLWKKSSEESSKAIFNDIYKRLLCPRDDPPVSEEKELDLHLNQISKYIVAKSRLDMNYFTSLLLELSCTLFKPPLEKVEFDRYRDLLEKPDLHEVAITAFKKKYSSVSVHRAITNGFLTVEKDTLRQLTYIQ